MKVKLLFLSLLWAWIGCNVLSMSKLPGPKEKFISSRGGNKIRKLYTVPNIKVSVENTFIFRLTSGESTTQTKNSTIKVKVAMKKFRSAMKKYGIPFVFIYKYCYGFEGFSVGLKYPKDVLKIEAWGLDFISDIMNDKVLYASSVIDGQGIWLNDQVVHMARRWMDVPNTDEGYLKGGKGITVAILDQGIRYTDPAFIIPGKTCRRLGEEGCRVKKVLDFVDHERKALLDSTVADVEPAYDERIDVYGTHGIAMASLIGGTMPLSPGIATQVSFHDYRMLDKYHSSTNARALAAVGFSVQHGADIISLSLGGFLGNKFGLVGPLFNLHAPIPSSEILITTAIGNDGLNERLFQINDLSNSNSILGVGSFRSPVYNNYHLKIQWYQIERKHHQEKVDLIELQNDCLEAFSSSSHTYFHFKEEIFWDPPSRSVFARNFPYTFFLFVVCEGPEHCLELAQRLQSDPKVLGIIFVCEIHLLRSTFQGIAKPLCQLQGASSNFPTTLQTMSHASGTVELDYVMSLDTAPTPSPVSSFGPSLQLGIKPDISLVGCQIRQYVGNNIGYVIGRGTSNANGIFAGILALYVKHFFFMRSPILLSEVITRMQNTARPSFPSKWEVEQKPHLRGRAYSVFQQGPGLLQVQPMLKTLLQIQPSKIELGYHFPMLQTNELRLTTQLKIHNSGDLDIQLFVQHVPATSFHYSTPEEKYEQSNFRAEVEFSIANQPLRTTHRFIFLPKRSTVFIHVSFYFFPSGVPKFTFFNGYLQFTPIDPSKGGNNHLVFMQHPEYPKLSVPYLFLYGDMQEYPIFSTKGERASFLTNSKVLDVIDQMPTLLFQHDRNTPLPFPMFDHPHSNAEFSFQPYDLPVLYLCPLLPVRVLDFYLFQYVHNEPLGLIRSYGNVPQQCYFFLVHESIYLTPGHAVPPWILEFRGWNGKYFPSSNPNQVLEVSNGYYRICVKTIPQIDLPQISVSPNYAWCSVGFKVNR